MHALHLALALVLAAPQASTSDAALRETVDAYLNTIDTPIAVERWKALGPAAAPILAEVAADPAELSVTRARAVWALAVVDAAAAAPVARKLADDGAAPPVVRTHAVRALGRVLPAAQLRAAVAPLMRSDRVPEVRAVAAEVLARHGGRAACADVRAQIEAEPADGRPAYHRAADLCR